MFEEYVTQGAVRKASRDAQLAKSLIRMADRRMKIVNSMDPSDENSFSIIENCYEAIRELSDALMALKGYKSYSHEANIDFLKAFYSAKVGMGNINKANRYRIIRNDIKYRGLLTTKAEAEDILKSAKALVSVLFELVKSELDGPA